MKCPKCGSMRISMMGGSDRRQVEKHCSNCGFDWVVVIAKMGIIRNTMMHLVDDIERALQD